MCAKNLINSDDKTVDEIQSKISELDNDKKVLTKLYFLLDVLNGVSIIKASEKIGITPQTGYNWIKEWNENQFEGLKRKRGSGVNSKLRKIQFVTLDFEIQIRDLKTTKEVRELIIELFDVEYSIRQIERIMKKLGYNYVKSDRIYVKNVDNK